MKKSPLFNTPGYGYSADYPLRLQEFHNKYPLLTHVICKSFGRNFEELGKNTGYRIYSSIKKFI